MDTETPAPTLASVTAALAKLPGLHVELVGKWLWITGDTFTSRAELKAAGLKWASRKRAWYWHAPEDGCRGGRKSLDEIRETYGAQPLALAA